MRSHFGICRVPESLLGTPKAGELSRAFVWHFVLHQNDGSTHYVGVSTKFRLVETGGPVPHYQAEFRSKWDHDLEVQFTEVNEATDASL